MPRKKIFPALLTVFAINGQKCKESYRCRETETTTKERESFDHALWLSRLKHFRGAFINDVTNGKGVVTFGTLSIKL